MSTHQPNDRHSHRDRLSLLSGSSSAIPHSHHMERRYQRLLRAVTDYLYMVEVEDGQVVSTFHGPGCANVTGYDSEEFQTKPYLWYDMIHPDDRDHVIQMTNRVLAGKSISPIEHRIIHKDGSIRWVSNAPVPNIDEHGRVVSYDGLITDITKRKRLEEELEARVDERTSALQHATARLIEELTHREKVEKDLLRLAAIVESSDDAIIRKNLDGMIEEWNTGAEHMYGYHAEEAVGQHISFLCPPESAVRITQLLDQVRQGQHVSNLETTRIRKDGTSILISLTISPIRDSDGSIIGVSTIARDITERKSMEQALQESEERYRMVSGLMSDYAYAFRVEPDGTLVREWVTDAFIRITGYIPDEVGQRGWPSIIYPDDMPIAIHRLRELLSGATNITEFRIITRSGDIRWVREHGLPVWDKDENRVVRIYGAAQDITSYKEAEEALSWESTVNATMAELSRSLLSLDTFEKISDQVLTYACRLTTSACGYVRYIQMQESDLQPPAWLAHFEQPTNESSEVRDAMASIYDEIWHWQVHHRKPFLTNMPGYDSAVAKLPPIPSTIHRLIFAPSLVRGTLVGQLVLINSSTDYTARDLHLIERFAALYALAIERRRVEETLLFARQQAEEAVRIKSEFVARMSHEIRTPLNAIIGMTSLLLETSMTRDQHDYVKTARMSGEALLDIINDILDFSKIEAERVQLEHQPFRLTECLEQAIDIVTPKAAEKQLDLAYLIDERLPPVVIGDASRLRQVLVNLLSNAVKFTHYGEVILSVAPRAHPPAEIAANEHVDDEQCWLHFQVRDTGIGIPLARQHELFQPFAQINNMAMNYGGTGLGLVISKRFIEMMDGRIWVESDEGRGSTFHFTIRVGIAVSTSVPLPSQSLAGKRAVFVDDNATNRHIFDRQARSWGMHPVILESGHAALDYFRQGGTADIAVLDMQMPEMDGLTLAQEIRHLEQRPSIHTPTSTRTIPLIMYTSIMLKNQAMRTNAADISAFLTKPIKPAVLHETLLQLCSGQSPTAPTGHTSVVDSSMGRLYPLRLLLAEDNIINQKVATKMLERLGYEADMVANGLEVLEAVHRQWYDVVLMDVQMPEMDGEQATHMLRTCIPPMRQPWIIAMTAHVMEGDRQRFLRGGMDDYVSKPIRIEELARALRCAYDSISHRGSIPLLPAIAAASSTDHRPVNPVMDSSVLERISETIGIRDDMLIRELLQTYLDDAPTIIARMCAAVERVDIQGYTVAAHTLKSSSLQLGMTTLAMLCEQMEGLDQRTMVAAARETMDQIEAEYARVYDELQRIIS